MTRLTLVLVVAAALGCGKTTNVDLTQFDGGTGRKVGGNVEGLLGTGLKLKNLGADEVAISRDGLFALPARLAPGAAYLVTVSQQPTAPAQTCAITGGQGFVGTADVLDIFVRCVLAAPVTIGGSVSGLVGSGLALQLGAGETLALAAGATSFVFATQVPTGEAYAVTIKRQPAAPLQVCTLQNGSGKAAAGLQISLTCSTSPAFSIGGTVSGLRGSGLVLQDNRGDDLALAAGATAFTFGAPVQQGAQYAVTVAAQPKRRAQACTLQGARGTVGPGNVTDVAVTCEDRLFSLGGTVSGLSGSGLLLRLGSEDLGVTADGGFAFAALLPGGAPYAVSVARQPVSPAQSCAVLGGGGVMPDGDVTSLLITCVTDPSYAISGTVSGLTGSGLVLQNEGGDDLVVGARATSFTFATGVQGGLPYAVTVKQQPSGPQQTCRVDAGSGLVAAADITSISLSCTTNPYFTVGGNVAGLAGEGLVLTDLGSDDLQISGNGPFSFATKRQGALPYSVAVKAQPFAPLQTCLVTGGDGLVGAADVTNVQIDCLVVPSRSIGGKVTGLAGTGLVLQQDGLDDLQIVGNGPFAFATPLQETTPYRVTIKSQPTNPQQACAVQGGSGVTPPVDLTSVTVSCTTNPSFSLGGSVVGLTGSGLLLHSAAGEDLPVPAAGPFTFQTKVQQGTPWLVTLLAQPAGQTCAVTAGGAGTMGAGAASSVVVTCGAGPFVALTAQVAGVTGSGLVLSNDGDDLTVTANGVFTFANRLVPGQAYALNVKTQPSAPQQRCTPGAGASGTAGQGDLLIQVTCVTAPFFNLSGVVSGLSGTGLLLANGPDLLPLTQDGRFTFATQLQAGTRFQVTVLEQPTGPLQTCAVTGGAGISGAADVTNVFVNCVANPYFTIGGFVGCGLASAGLQLQQQGSADVISVNPTNACPGQNTFFIFPTLLQSGQSYGVSVKQQPLGKPTQSCSVTRGTGTVIRTVSNVSVTCTQDPSYAVGGTVSGLLGTGLVLRDNGGDDLPVTKDGAFVFAKAVQTRQPYSVTVFAQPQSPTQSCRVVSGSGTVGAGAVNTVQVICTVSAFTVGGTVTGLLTGSSVTLIDNGFDQRTVAGNASGTVAFAFGTGIASGRTYSAAVSSTTGPVSCAITGGAAGTVSNAAINPVAVTCIPAFTIAGTIAGNSGTGLQLANAATGEVITVGKGAASFAFTKPVSTAQGYSISVVAQPAALSQTCAVTASSPSPPSGNPSANVTDLAIGCVTNSFAIGGAVLGLPAGASLSLFNSGGDALAVPGSGDGSAQAPFTFATTVPSGAAYSVTLAAQSGPVSCAVTSGNAGTVAAANVGAVLITCVPTFTIAGTLAGYTGTGLVLRNTIIGGAVLESLTVAPSSTAFAFTRPVTRAQGYAISVATPPAGPAQVCSPSGSTPTPPSGSPTANVTDLALACAASSFTVGGTVTGLPAGATVTLLNNGVDSKAIAGAGTGSTPAAFTFTTRVASGARYAAVITATTGPVSCSVTGGSGPVNAATVTSIAVACVPGFTLAGTLTGYAGSGLSLTNAATGETVSPAKGATAFNFARPVSTAQGYAITIGAQPAGPTQTCAPAAASDPLTGNPAANVNALALACTTTAFAVGGVVTGLPGGASVTLQNGGADNTVVAGAGNGQSPVPFSFVTPVKSGATWAATLSSSTGPVNCAITAGASGTVGASPSSAIVVACTQAFFVSGTVPGYLGAGLQIRNNTTNEVLTLASGQTTFAFTKPVTNKLGYSLSVLVQPQSPTQACGVLATSLAPPIGNPTSDVTNLAVTCTTSAFSVGGKVTGLPAGSSVTLLDNGIDTVKVNGTGDGSAAVNFNFPTQVFSGQPWSATLTTVAGPVVCALTSAAAGTMAGAPVSSLLVACVPGFTVAGTVAGYLGANLILVNAPTGEQVAIAPGQSPSAFSFKRPVSTAQGYAITVLTQPVNPAQACVPAASSPSPASGAPVNNVTDLTFVCTTSAFTVGGTVRGLATGQSLVLSNDGVDDLPLSAGVLNFPRFTFATKVPSGQGYTVAVRRQPPGQVCSVRGGAGLVGAGDYKGVLIDCLPTQLVGGKVKNYLGSGLVLSNGTDTIAVSTPPGTAGGADVPFTFPTPLSRGTAFQVAVANAPVNPAQPCTASGGPGGGGGGIIGLADDFSLVITCGTPAWKVGGTVVGLATGQSAALVMIDNVSDLLILASNASSTSDARPFQFPTPVPQGRTYQVVVQTPPAGLVCSVAGGSGTVGEGDVTSVRVLCGYPVQGAFDLTTLAGVTGQAASTGLSLTDAVAWAADGYSGGAAHAITPGATTFTLGEPVPRGGTCALSVTAQPAGPAQLCAVLAQGGCTGGVVTAPLAAQVRCVQQVELLTLSGAVGPLSAVAVDPQGDVVASGNFTGTANLGHGARAGSTFSATGSGLVFSADPAGRTGAAASPLSANWDRLFPAPAALPANAGSARVRAVAVLAGGDVVVGGGYTGSVDLGDGAGPLAPAASESMFLARVSSGGSVLWARRFGAGLITSLAASPAQIVAGGVYGAAAGSQEPFGGAPCGLIAPGAHRDFVAGFDASAGACNFSLDVGGGADPAGSALRLGPAVALDSVGEVIAVGSSADATAPSGSSGPWLATWDSAGKSPCVAGGVGNELLFVPSAATSSSSGLITGVAVGAGDALFVSGQCQGSAPKVKGTTLACGTAGTAAFVAKYSARTTCVAGTAGAPAQLQGPSAGRPLTLLASGGTSKALAISTDAAGNVLLAGLYSGTPSLAGVTLFAGSAVEAQSAFASRLTGALTAPAHQAVNATGPLQIKGVSPGALGSLWVSGSWSGTVTYRGRSPALGTTAAVGEPMLLHFPQGPP